MKYFYKLIPSVLIILQVSSCGIIKSASDNILSGNEASRIYSNSDPEFAKLIQVFEDEAKIALNQPNFLLGDVPINFADTGSPDYKGVCITYPDGKKEVLVQRAWWQTADKMHQESLIFHELGHCRLGRSHDDQMFTIGKISYKASMMNKYIVNPTPYSQYKKEYIVELFTSDKTDLSTSFGIK